MSKRIIITKEGNGLVTKEFAKQAKIFGTEEYKAWREFLEVYPKSEMKTKEIKRSPNKKTFRNMTYNNITIFIQAQDNSESLLKEFQKQLELAKIQKSPYHYVVNWFVKIFPNYSNHETFKVIETNAA